MQVSRVYSSLMTIKVKSLLKMLSSDDLLENLTLEKIITFMHLASHLHLKILHTQRPVHPEEVAPESNLLPLNMTQFLVQSMNWTHLMVKKSWDILCDII
jgi:hypothetical protein